MKRHLLFAVLIIALWSCQDDQVAPQEGIELRQLSIEEQELVRASNNFAIDLTKVLLEDADENLFYSPYYIHMDLSMAMNGAENNTLMQMQRVQQCEVLKRLEVNKVYNSLNSYLQGVDDHMRFVSAHSLWHRQELAVRPLFSDMVMAYYGAGVQALDFHDLKASSHISKWIEDNTSGKIDVEIPTILPYESLYLISATHLKAQWTFPFAKESTAPGTFFLNDKKEVTVPMMFTDQASYRYHQDSQKTLVDIPFGNQQFSMTLLMPAETDSIHTQLSTLTIKSLEQDLENADTLDYYLYLPKFNISSQLALKEPLAALGIKDAFTSQADFSGILQDSAAVTKVADLIHTAGLEMNESGVQTATPRVAAANTSSGAPVVRINRPFMFFVRENHSGVILYAGYIHHPLNQINK